ncbi:hypothetical protein K501DRAFT_152861, partial [Backusella circina FSU 941]
STVEYYQLAEFKKHVIACSKYGALHLQKRMILANSPTFKVSSTTRFKDATINIFTNFRKITRYYDRELWQNKSRFRKYISKQKVSAEICKRLLNGSSKYQSSASPVQASPESKKGEWRPSNPRDLPEERGKTIIIAYG